ncbi:MAG: hypothetical protein WD627_11465 [Actinomycetota bacterium]
MIDPASVASQRSLYALGLGLLAFLASASPVGILGLAIPAGIGAVALGIGEVRKAARRSKTRQLAGAGVAFTVLGFLLAVGWIYAGFAFASSFGGSPRIDFGRLMCTACHVLADRQAAEVEQPSDTSREALDEPSRPVTAICTESPDLVPVWPEGEISGICAGTEGLAQDGPWRRDARGTALQFPRAVLSWPGAEVASAEAGTGSRMIFEVRRSPTQRVRVVVNELMPGTWTVIGVDAVPERGGLSLLVSGRQVTAEASPPEGASSTEVKTVGYRGSQASASSTGGRIALGVPEGPNGRAPGWLLVLSKDANGQVLTAEAVQLPEGTADFRIP